MRSMKKLIVGFILALCVSMVVAPSAFAESGTYVFDEQGILKSSEFSTLEGMGADYANEYNVGVYLLITDTMNGKSDPSSSERNEFARQYYQSHDLGVGANKDGIIFVIAVKSRDYVTVKHFNDKSTDPFSDNGVDALEEDVKSYLKNNNWYGGSRAYYDTVGEQLSYFAATGKQWTEPDPLGLLLKILATLGIPAAVAGVVVRGEKAAMKTAREASEASNYLDRSSFQLTASHDDFVNTSMSAVPIPKNEGKSGGGWSDMGGGFSGSGGGKF